MVVIVDFEEEDLDRFHGRDAHHMLDMKAAVPLKTDYEPLHVHVERRFFQNSVTEAFAQYPILESLVQHIDLNTLDSLARTSYLVHQGLVQHRLSLLKATLHCVNHDAPVDPDATFRHRARAGNHFFDLDAQHLRGGLSNYLPYNGKSGKCARDMVSECRKCGIAVCRNCTIKQPGSNALKDRHRRLCMTCVDAPLASLLGRGLDPSTPVTSEAVQRELCKCDQGTGVWLCQPCGRSIRASDSDYQRIWRWRSQYGEVLGGLGTGIGDGDRGVICGQEQFCIAAREREQEIDCDAEDARDSVSSQEGYMLSPERPGTPLDRRRSSTASVETRTPSPLQLGPGYARHEIEGIGGIVKRKLVRMVRVGACVPEWEDEKSRHGILRKERSHEVRSICGWCCRMIPGKTDLQASS